MKFKKIMYSTMAFLIIVFISISAYSITAENNKEYTVKINEQDLKVENLKSNFNLEAQKVSYDSGSSVQFNVYLKVTGSKTVFNNAQLTIKLPDEDFISFKQALSDLKIANTTPIYNEATKEL
ncbi:hypothetical protein LJB88_05270, partial [Erysipelotrichaceae bacterium OttesenSCG-928-M19]|nr:hypothetical protein [Erysipelotrichaceae bacterium OttesenSCG-928-M19]